MKLPFVVTLVLFLSHVLWSSHAQQAQKRRNTSDCRTFGQKPLALTLNSSSGDDQGDKPVALMEGIILIIVFGIFAALVADLFSWIRREFYKDKENVDTSFDAGGNVSIGLTATTIVSQWTWAATLLQSSNVGTKYGISGPFWYASGATVQILLFAIMSIQLKINSPGAKTFLQVVRARFDRNTHLVLCVFALLCNMVVTAMLMLGGIAVMASLVQGLQTGTASVIIAVVIGGYTFIGGLGATFYVSYFNTALIFVIMLWFVVKVYTDPFRDDNSTLGSIRSVHELLACVQGPETNYDSSYLTILSPGGLMFGIINLIGNFGTFFVDQSYWQSSVAAKPRQGVWGFLSGGLCWFSVPFCMATTLSLAYLALSASEGKELLTEQQRDEGLVPPIVATKLMGQTGSFLILLMILMAVTSTGSAEVIAVASILVYDICQNYIRPFTTDEQSYRHCILCKNIKPQYRTSVTAWAQVCRCCSLSQCDDCAKDDAERARARIIKPPFTCPLHGKLRAYGDSLLAYKNWIIVCVTIAIIPITLILEALSVSLGWVYLFMGILIGPAVIPIALVVCWDRLSSGGVIAGSLIGVVCGFVTWLSVASTYPGGLAGGHFLENTGREVPMLCGNCVSIGVGGIVCVVISLWQNRHMTEAEREEVWEKTRGVDNILWPWSERYAKEFNLSDLSKRPTREEVHSMFATAKTIAYGGGISLALILFVLWPALMTTVKAMDLSHFTAWVIVSMMWAYLAAAFLIFVPPIQEVFDAIRVKRKRDEEIRLRDEARPSEAADFSRDNPAIEEDSF